MLKKIHSIVSKGFELKIINYVIAAAIIFLFWLVIRNLS